MLQKKIQALLKEMEDEEKAQVVRLGDASIASPFSSKLSTTVCGKVVETYFMSLCEKIGLGKLLFQAFFDVLTVLHLLVSIPPSL